MKQSTKAKLAKPAKRQQDPLKVLHALQAVCKRYGVTLVAFPSQRGEFSIMDREGMTMWDVRHIKGDMPQGASIGQQYADTLTQNTLKVLDKEEAKK